LFFIAIGWGVIGVAVASAVSACAYVTAFLAIGLRMVGRRGRRFASDLARALFPLAACVVFVACLAVGPEAGPGRTWLAAAILVAASAIALGGIASSLKRSRLEA